MHVLSLLWILCSICSHSVKVRALQLRGCDVKVNSPLDLIENQDNVITCEDIQGTDSTVSWIRVLESFLFVGDCYSNLQCDVGNPAIATLSRPNYTTSTMTLKNVNRSLYSNKQVKCYTTKPSDPSVELSSATCYMNVIFPAILSTDCQVQVVKSSRPWMVNGTCSVVKAYTVNNDIYNCLWFHTPPSGLVYQIPVSQTQGRPSLTCAEQSTGNCTYFNFTCSFQVNMPDVQGNHSYKVTANPGGVNGPGIIVKVDHPHANPVISCNTTNVLENTDVQCNCTAVDFGEPKGYLQVQRAGNVLVGNETDGRNVTFNLHRVNRTNDGETLTCFLYWVQNKCVTYNLSVVYGPDLVSLNDPGVFDLHPTSPSQLNFTCTANGFKPSVTYKWSGFCNNSASNICSFTPSATNNGDNISCTAINTVTNVQKTSNNLTLTIHYPPSTSPVVSGNTGQILYSGQLLTMNCTVSGGNPPVTNVTFSCGGQGQTSVGTSSVINITLNSSRDGQKCVCSANWKNKTADWYTQTANFTLKVYYAPVAPTVSNISLFPFLDGESPTLVCSFPAGANRGNPPATLTWSGAQETSSQNETKLTLTSLNGPVDNNRKVVCEASNNFTVHNRSSVITEFRLEVYYISDVSLRPLDSSDCIPTPSPDLDCVVDEGQSVRVNCSAQGNPAIQTIAWQHVTPPSSTLSLVANRTTSVEHICDVRSTSISGDARLPLNKSRSLRVYTRFPSTVRQFLVNGQSTNLTVNESTTVNLTCTAEGRPTPALRLAMADKNKTLNQTDLGQDKSAIDSVTIDHTIAMATCEIASQYTCGNSSSTLTALFLRVNCSPRNVSLGVKVNKQFNFVGTPLKIPLDFVAYPQPNTYWFTFLGPSGNLTVPVMRDIMNITCWEIRATYNFSCNITVDNINDTLAGNYSLTLKNEFGTALVYYSVTVNENKTDTFLGNEVDPALIGGAVAAALIGAGIVIGVICGIFIYKRRKDPGAKKHRKLLASESKRNTENEVTITNSLYGTSPISNDLHSRREHAGGDYEIVNINSPETGPKSKPPIAPKTSPGNENSSEKSTQLNKAADDVYATVVKDKKIAKLQPVATSHAAGSSQAGMKVKAGKGDKQKTEKGKGKQNVKKVIGNSPLSMKPMDNSVYENYAFQMDVAPYANNADKKVEDMTAAPETDSASASSSRNQDGLVYVAIDFTPGQQTKAMGRPPKRDITEYAGIDFSKRAHVV